MLHAAQMSQKIAQLLLDFQPDQSVCGDTEDTTIMDDNTLELVIKAQIAQIARRMGEAAGLAKAAEAGANAGNIPKAIEIALDLEPLLYEANTLLNGASLMHRIWKT